MRFIIFLLFMVGGAGVLALLPAYSGKAQSSGAVNTSDLPDYGPAPELTNRAWLNTERPLRLARASAAAGGLAGASGVAGDVDLWLLQLRQYAAFDSCVV